MSSQPRDLEPFEADASGDRARRDVLSRARGGLVLCGYCDTVHRRTPIAQGSARCRTCDSLLYRGGAAATVGSLLAIAATAASAFVIGLGFPLVSISSRQRNLEVSLWDAAGAAQEQGMSVVAIVLGVTLLIAPLLELALLLYVLVPLAAGVRPPGFVGAMRVIHQLRPWRMIEVFLLGVAVAFVKLAGMASVEWGWGLFGVALMTVALAMIGRLDREAMWRRADEVSP